MPPHPCRSLNEPALSQTLKPVTRNPKAHMECLESPLQFLFGLTKLVIRILEGIPKKELQWRL